MADFTVEELWRLFKATDEKIARMSEAMDRRHAETEAAIARSQARTDAALQKLSRQMGDISNRLGEFAEDMVVPAAERLFLEWGLPIHRVYRNVSVRSDEIATEFDILVVNDGHVMAIEVKSRPDNRDVDEHVARLDIYKRFAREQADWKLYGAIAGMSWADGADRYAYRQGLFVLGQSGETVTILNREGFRPRVW